MNTTTPAEQDLSPIARIPLIGKKELLVALLITVATGAFIAWKVLWLGYGMSTIEEQEGYSVRLSMDVAGNGRDCDVRLTLPVVSERQAIIQERQVAEGFQYTISPGRIGKWSAKDLADERTIVYSFLAQTQEKKWKLPVGTKIEAAESARLQSYLVAEERTQVADPEIAAKALQLAPEGTELAPTVDAIFNYCARDVKYLEAKGPTDALTALRLGEASCNGKVRLMVALLRAKGIPARMANGLILESSRKRTTHAWAEAWIVDGWVPFCPTNGWFAEIPEHYLELAKGDVAVMTHTRNIGFDWQWRITHHLKHREKAMLSNADHPLNILRAWTSLKEYHVSLSLIMVILMIPIGATVVAFSRNIVGVTPYGTFMPALVAVSFRDTGFLFGSIMFATVILIGCGANMALMKLRLLHIPRLTAIITTVVLSILALSVVCIRLGITSGAAVSLFPMAILSLTCERFTMATMTDGWKVAFTRLIVTFVVSSACFVVINWTFLQLLVAAFPELLLVNIAINIVMGSWTGMRIAEIFRFGDRARAATEAAP